MCPRDSFLNPGTGECVNCPDGTHSQEGSVSTSAAAVCKAKRNCTIEDLPKKYQQKCLKRIENPAIPVVESFYKPYTLDVTNFTGDHCSLTTAEEVGKVYEDAMCGYCEAGNVLKFSGTNDI